MPPSTEQPCQADGISSGEVRTSRRPLRLVHVLTVPISLRFLRGQLGFMKSEGVEVHFVCAPGPGVAEFAAAEGATPHTLPLTRSIDPRRDLLVLFQLVRLLRQLAPDIVHAHTPKAGLLGMVGAWLARVPVRIYHLHGLPLATARGGRRRILEVTERLSCAAASHILCVSDSLKREFVERGLCKDERIAVPLKGSINGVDPERFDPAPWPPERRARLRSELGIERDALVIGFFGRFVRDKGIVELARAWRGLARRHPEARLLMVGSGDDTDPLPAETMRELERDPRVHWVPFTDDIVPYYALIDVLALPTYREGYPTVPLEAAAMGVPTVASRVTGCVDAIVDDQTGALIAPQSAMPLERALGRYLADEELRLRHGSAARERALRDYEPRKLWEALLREYWRASR